MKVKKIIPQDYGKLLFDIDIKSFSRDFDCPAKTVEEEVRYLTGSEVYLVYNGSKAIGLFAYKIDATDAEIMQVMFLPEFQNKGYGRKVMEIMLENLKNYYVKIIVHPRNKYALILYLKMGFVIYGWKDNYYGDGQPRLLLELKRSIVI